MYERTEEILSALRNGDLSPVQAETEKQLKRILRGVNRGMLTVQEAMTLILRDQYSWNRRQVFEALGLTLPMPEADWLELRSAWHDAVRGFRRELPAEEEARDKAQRLRQLLNLLTALAIPVFSLEQPPESMPVPGWMPVYTGGIVSETQEKSIWLKKAEDGGLRKDPDPVGKTYLLRGDFGIEVRITISCVQESSRGIPGPIWVGTGYITHLTALENRSDPTIRLSLGKKGGAVINWQEDKRDRASYETDPLWAEFRAWNRHMEDKQTLWLDALLRLPPEV